MDLLKRTKFKTKKEERELKKIILAAVAALLMGQAAHAVEINTNGYVGMETKYVFRGIEQTTNPSVIAGVSGNYEFLTLSADVTTLSTTRQVEYDLGVDVTLPMTNYLDVSAGLVNYSFTGFNPKTRSTTDLYIGLGTSAYGFGLTAKAYRLIQTKNIWTDIQLSKSVLDFDLYVKASYAAWKDPTVKDEFELLTYGVSRNFSLSYFDLTAGFDATNALGRNKFVGNVKTRNLYNGYLTLNF